MTKPRARVLNATAQQIAAISAVEDIRFWEKTRVEGECLVWTGYRDRDGYGVVGRQDVSPSPILAHRYAFYLANGPYGDGQIIRHSCDNPPCVKPAHLLTGTQYDNIQDRQIRGRHRPGRFPGEAHPSHRLTNEDVLEMRRLRREGYTAKAIARAYGLNYDWACKVIRGAAWSHLKGEAA